MSITEPPSNVSRAEPWTRTSATDQAAVRRCHHDVEAGDG
jgi:hypothetical protein